MQIFIPSRDRVYIVDVHTLKNTPFTASGRRGRSLKTILESPDDKKVFFDFRNDSDALFAHLGIRV
jgi:exonuclease 3'-5' domain-containing protein 1